MIPTQGLKKLTALACLSLSLAPALSSANSAAMMSYLRNDRNYVNANLNEKNCVAIMNRSTKDLGSINSDSIMLPEIKANAKALIEESFTTRLQILERFKQISIGKKLGFECENAIRKNIIARRLFEEWMGITADLDDSPEVFEGQSPQLLVNPVHGPFKLQSGDVLVSRGTAVVSAAIAKVGDQEGIFSHAAMVYVDPNTQKVYVIQSEIETGTEVEPIEKNYMSDGKVRAIAFRHKDPVLAAKAAEHATKVALAARSKGQQIPYDFKMDLSETNDLFCSEVPYMAFKEASQNRVILGQKYSTTFVQRKNRYFLDSLGISVPSTYSPNDVEFDDQMELVAEWRDYSRVGKAHRRDAVMASVFDWIEHEGYRFNSLYNSLESKGLLLLRHLPLVNNLVKGSVADNIQASTLKSFMVMNNIGSVVIEDLIAQEEKVQERIPGKFLTYNEMLDLMKVVKQEDLAREENYREFSRRYSSQEDPYKPEQSHFMKYFDIKQK